MNIWLIIWILISSTLIGFSIWTGLILYKQKQAWRKFAADNKLRYRSKAMMLSPEINGVYKEYPISVFTSEYLVGDGRSERKMTAIEVELGSRMPIAGAMGSKGMVEIIQSLSFSDTYQPSDASWDVENIIRCDDKKIIEAYLEPPRLKVLTEILDKKNVWGLFIFRDNDTILRVDTPEPLEGAKDLQNLVDEMIAAATILELRDGESKGLLAYKTQRAATRNQRIEVEDTAEEPAFELEDDEAQDAEVTGEEVTEETEPKSDDGETVQPEAETKLEPKPKSRTKPKAKAAGKKKA